MGGGAKDALPSLARLRQLFAGCGMEERDTPMIIVATGCAATPPAPPAAPADQHHRWCCCVICRIADPLARCCLLTSAPSGPRETDVEAWRSLREAGAGDILVKPLNLLQLRQLRDACAARHERPAAARASSHVSSPAPAPASQQH